MNDKMRREFAFERFLKGWDSSFSEKKPVNENDYRVLGHIITDEKTGQDTYVPLNSNTNLDLS
jgi:hypothetical protein